MTTITRPTIRRLDRAESEAILSRNHVGRLAYARANRIDIEPVHYVYADGWIYGRTSAGSKTQLLGDRWWPVAFEVDEVEELFRWRSVVVHGGLYPVSKASATEEDPLWSRAVELLRTLVPDTFRENDPVPERTLVFRIAVQEITGRQAEPGSDEQAEAGATLTSV
jgi:uncharacterized protein